MFVSSTLFLPLACLFFPANADSVSAIHSPQKWQLIKAEEFNTPGSTPPNPELWDYERGLVRNKELQSYETQLKNAYVSNGVLTLKAYRENVLNRNVAKDSSNWRSRAYSEFSSASICTFKKFAVQYGRVEISAKLPGNIDSDLNGMWPAIWMMGDDRDSVGWPKCGEIDIMEYVSMDTETIWGTTHWFSERDSRTHHASRGKIIKVPKKQLVENFNIYAIEWDSQKMNFFFNDSCYYSFDISDKDSELCVFHKPHYLILNLAIGGWAKTPPKSLKEAAFQVDYVRFYKRKD